MPATEEGFRLVKEDHYQAMREDCKRMRSVRKAWQN